MRPVTKARHDALLTPAIPSVTIRNTRMVGSMFSQRLRIRNVRWIKPASTRAHPKVKILRARPFAKLSKTPSYWREAGWRRRNGSLYGHYHAGLRSYRGEIQILDSIVEPYRCYIYKPPRAFREGIHRLCVRNAADEKSAGWYFIHFRILPPDVTSAMEKIEQELAGNRKN